MFSNESVGPVISRELPSGLQSLLLSLPGRGVVHTIASRVRMLPVRNLRHPGNDHDVNSDQPGSDWQPFMGVAGERSF
jgi:hypothetical protein